MNDNFTSNQELLIDNILFNFVLVKLGFNMSVFMPYIERLTGISNWYRQIIAESLGKDGKGFTLIRAKGTLDQHSQLQLYLDGPKDKSFTFIKPLEIKKGLKISVPKEIKDLSYLSNKTLDGILYVEQESVIRSLRKSYMPIRQINLSKLDEETLGAILMFFMLEVICLAELYEIDAFDQPAVEFGKKLTKEMLLEKY